jgi:hypothetical protein
MALTTKERIQRDQIDMLSSVFARAYFEGQNSKSRRKPSTDVIKGFIRKEKVQWHGDAKILLEALHRIEKKG